MPILLLCRISPARTFKPEPERAPDRGRSRPSRRQLTGGAQPSWAPRRVPHPLDAAIALHDRDAEGGFDRPDQNAGAFPWVSLETLSMNETP